MRRRAAGPLPPSQDLPGRALSERHRRPICSPRRHQALDLFAALDDLSELVAERNFDTYEPDDEGGIRKVQDDPQVHRAGCGHV